MRIPHNQGECKTKFSLGWNLLFYLMGNSRRTGFDCKICKDVILYLLSNCLETVQISVSFN